MVSVALFVRLEAKPGKEDELLHLLHQAYPMVLDEPGTPAWFAIRFDPSTFAIFDAFPDAASRDIHLAGRVAAALGDHASELLARPLVIEEADVFAFKLPQS